MTTNNSLPNYAGDHDIFDLYDLLAGYHAGQGDPVYRTISTRDPNDVSDSEISAILYVLRRIVDGRYQSDGTDWDIANSWLPVMDEIDNGERVCLGCGVTICGSTYCDKCEE